MDWVIYAALICGALGVAYSLITAGWVFKQDAGNARMQEISGYVAEGAMAYLTRQYKVVLIIAIILFIVLWATLGPIPAIGFAVGAALAGCDLSGHFVAHCSSHRLNAELVGRLLAEAARDGLAQTA